MDESASTVDLDVEFYVMRSATCGARLAEPTEAPLRQVVGIASEVRSVGTRGVLAEGGIALLRNRVLSLGQKEYGHSERDGISGACPSSTHHQRR